MTSQHPFSVRCTATLLLMALLGGCTFSSQQSVEVLPLDETSSHASSSSASVPMTLDDSGHDAPPVQFADGSTTINSAIAADFSLSEAKNLQDITTAYGITLSAKDMEKFAKQKFLMKRLSDTNIRPKLSTERGREFMSLYNAIVGSDAKSRTQANTLFWSSDIFLHSFMILQVELLKEMENTVFAPAMLSLSKEFFLAATEKMNASTTDGERMKWNKVRMYFAVPYTLLSTAEPPLMMGGFGYRDENGVMRDPGEVSREFYAKDASADSEQSVIAFVDTLNFDSVSKKAVLADLHAIVDASGPAVPAVLSQEFSAYADKANIRFSVDFTQFTPRSHYTSSSYRRQYFRAMKWYIDIPFFVGSDALTEYAFAIGQLFAEHPKQLKSYSLLESTINFFVGTSDDLMPVDYLTALQETRDEKDQAAALRAWLLKAKQPKIKSLAAAYPSVGDVQSDDVLERTKGMRFFSGKFILDSYWTGYLTQGDEEPRPGYPAKLPPMASSLQVMALLGSEYAKSKIPSLDFYTKENRVAIDKAMNDLAKENSTYTEDDWRKNAYTLALWTIKGIFDFQSSHTAVLPRFMQSEAWAAKSLLTASGFWTELRHAVLLYAKESFAEKGGGGGCDDRTVPEPPKGYIEPQPLAYARLTYLARRLQQALTSMGFHLTNQYPLDAYVQLMDKVMVYTQKQLANEQLVEVIAKHDDIDPDQPSGKCIWYEIKQSDWEWMRRQIMDGLEAALPVPAEGTIIAAKDRRTALVADVHTGGDSSHETKILYEAIGVPYVILTAVKDANGPRIAIGFTYSHYEFTEKLGGKRMTDEDWQKNFYKRTDNDTPFEYTDPASHPTLNPWYAPLF